MFKRKECKNCKRKINSDYLFCPYCGFSSESKKENWGMLGKSDSNVPEQMSFLSGNILNNGMLGKMLNSAMKMLEKEMRNQGSISTEGLTGKNFELIINGKKIDPKNIKVSKTPVPKLIQEPKKKSFANPFSQRNMEKVSKLPKENPSTNIRRLSDKIIYELDVPGVKSIKDVSIVPLENSIEIKAISKDKLYSKLIPINFPIINYSLNSEKLILELDSTKNNN